MVSFNSIPAGWKLPLVSIEVDPSQAGSPSDPKYALLTDYMIAAGTALADMPIAVGNVATAKALFGDGSPLARAFERFFAINRSTPIYCLPITPPGSGVAATGTLVVSAAATVSGTLSLYIAGQKIPVGVLSTDNAAAVATKINAAINAMTTLPVASSVSTATLTLTAKWKGITGNDIRVEANVLGVNGAEIMPTGLTLTFPTNNALSGGTGVPDWTNAIAALGDDPYEFVSMAHNDSGSLAVWGTEYGFSDSGRWGWLREDYGHVFSAKRDSYANLLSYGANNNSGVISIMVMEKAIPTPIWDFVAAYTAQAAKALTNDPARPLHTLTFDGVLPPPKGSRFSKTELNALAGIGLAIQATGAGNVIQILREQTSYQKNTLNQADTAYELVTTLATLAEVFRRLRSAISTKYARHKLVNDGTRLAPGQAAVSPNILRAELVSGYYAMEFDGLVENPAAFKANLIVERDPNNNNRVNVLYPPDLANQLRHVAVLAQFRLQYALPAAA